MSHLHRLKLIKKYRIKLRSFNLYMTTALMSKHTSLLRIFRLTTFFTTHKKELDQYGLNKSPDESLAYSSFPKHT